MKYGGADARREAIRDRLRHRGFLEIGVLARDLNVSEMTVRRDLRLLHQEGALHLMRGGASLPMTARNGAFDARAAISAEGKRRVGHHAVRLIEPGDAIAIDAGTTGYALAEALPGGLAGCVVTHSLPVLQLLGDRDDVQMIGLGGEIHRPSRAFTGPLAVEAASRLHVRIFFLGVAALDPRGAYVATDIERPTKLKLMEIAERVVVLADRTKFGRLAPVLLCPLTRLHALIADSPPPETLAQALAHCGVSVELAVDEPTAR